MKSSEIIIKTIYDYIKKIDKLGLFNEESSFPKIYYRGEADASWNQKASLFRKNDENSTVNDALWTRERDLIKSAKMYYPEVFADCPNAISRLVKMQHYLMPTRLYDITSNPLVALYFACSSEPSKDGVVLYTRKSLSDISIVNIMADLTEILDGNEESAKNLCDFLRVNDRMPNCSDENSLEIFLFKYVTESFVFQPPLDNERIKRQSGAMIFSALMTPFDPDTNYTSLKKKLQRTKVYTQSMKDVCFSMCNDVNLRDIFEKKCFYIESTSKKRILQELDLIGINEAFVYPEIEHKMKTIKYKNLPKNELKLDL